MNNTFTNNVNQSTQQQYLDLQSFETQGQQIQKNIYFEQQDKLDGVSVRINFLKKVLAVLLIEFFITFVIFLIGEFTYLLDVFLEYIIICTYYDKYGDETYEHCYYYFAPTWVFYLFLSASMTLQFTLYFGRQSGRQVMHPYLFFFFYQIFFGFTFTVIWTIMNLNINIMAMFVTWGTVALIIFGLMCYVIFEEKDLSFQVGAIMVFVISLFVFIIFVIIDSSDALQFLLYAFISIIYGLYLVLELRLMLNQNSLKLQIDEYLVLSMLLYALMLQPVVRICEFIYNTCITCSS
ncbi:unnamed protein product [Paramecium octaurelia]|uniref:Transmembrane protein n=1 Tax=Paramecium octaurelia TaxID=43137 RepID=A0A8S1XCJ0_PAROT|nr:unnamed protein product [Paramecium octaurelia]